MNSRTIYSDIVENEQVVKKRALLNFCRRKDLFQVLQNIFIELKRQGTTL